MKHKVLKSIQYCLLVCLLFVSSFSLVLARYQVTHSEEISFSVRGVEEYIVQNASSEWIMNHETGNLESSFRVHNASGNYMSNHDLMFNIHVLVDDYVSNNMQLKMVMKDVSGLETVYTSKVLGSNAGKREYTFVEANGNEVDFTLSSESASYLEFDLVVIGADDAFLSEVVIIDGGYDVRANTLDMSAQYSPLVVKSNFLSKDSIHNIYIDESTRVTMESNLGMNSKISCTTESTLIIPSIDVSELYLSSNSIQGVNVSWTVNQEALNLLEHQTTETITVVWQVIDERNVVVEEWKGNFLVVVGPLAEESEGNLQSPSITINYEDDVISQLKPFECTIQSTVDTQITLKEEDFLAGTKYSLDKGNSWYVLAKNGGVDLTLKAEEPVEVMLDLVLPEWENEMFRLNAFWGENSICSVYLNEKNEQIIPLEVSNVKSGIINKDHSITFTTNKGVIKNKDLEKIDLILEKLQDGKYEEINKDTYFAWTNEIVNESTKYTISTLENITIPSGTYRVKIQQKYSDILISEEFVSFFVKA